MDGSHAVENKISKPMIVEGSTDTKIIFKDMRKDNRDIRNAHRKDLTQLVIGGPEGEDRETRIKTIFKHVMLHCFNKLKNISSYRFKKYFDSCRINQENHTIGNHSKTD